MMKKKRKGTIINDVFVVRIIPVIMFLYLIYTNILCWNGSYDMANEHLFGNSADWTLSYFISK